MPRKRKTAQPTKEADSTTTTMTVEPPVEKPAEPLPVEQQTSFVERLGERSSRPATPDPLLIASDNLAGVRLFESKRDRVMAIGFNERPTQAVLDLVKQAGFRWNPEERVWMHAIVSDSAMATRIDAERLYQEVRQIIRQDKGTDTGQDIPF